MEVVVDVCGSVKPSVGFAVLVVVSNGIAPGSVDLTFAANTKFVFVPTIVFATVLAGVVVAVGLGCPPSCPAKLNPVVLCPRPKPCTGWVVPCVLAGVVPNEKPGVACVAGVPPEVKPG